MHLSQEHVRLCLREEPPAVDRRELGRVPQDQDLAPEGERVLPHRLVDHAALVQDDPARRGQRTLLPESEADLPPAVLADVRRGVVRAVDRRVKRARPAATLLLHDQGSLPGVCRVQPGPAVLLRQVPSEEALPCPGEAKEPEHLAPAGILHPAKDAVRGLLLLRRELDRGVEVNHGARPRGVLLAQGPSRTTNGKLLPNRTYEEYTTS